MSVNTNYNHAKGITGRFRKMLDSFGMFSKKPQFYFLEFDYLDEQNHVQSFYSEGVLDYNSIITRFGIPFLNWKNVRIGNVEIPQSRHLSLKLYKSNHDMSQIRDQYRKQTGLCPGTGQWSYLEKLGFFKDISKTLYKDCQKKSIEG